MVIVTSAGLCASISYGDDANQPTILLNKNKSDIVSGIAQAQDYLGKLRIQDVKNKIDLLNLKLTKIRSGLSTEESSMLKSKIDTIAMMTALKEDSLVKIPLSILHTQGSDAALAYIQNNLRKYGVSEKKTNAIEKKVLEEAPKVRQEMEKLAIEKTIILLKNGLTPAPGQDPYILVAAKRAIKAHSDSLLAFENDKKRKDDVEKQKQDRLRQEKIAKEKKAAEGKTAQFRKEKEMAAKTDSLAALQMIHEQEKKEFQEKQAVKDKAREMGLELTAMLNNGQSLKAMDKFQDQSLVLSVMEPNAYNALEHAIVGKAIQELTEPVPAGKRNLETTTA